MIIGFTHYVFRFVISHSLFVCKIDRTSKMDTLHVLIVLIFIINTIHCTGDRKLNLLPLHKCCSPNQFVGQLGRIRKVCLDNPDGDLDLSMIPIYNDGGEMTEKTMNGTFNIVAGKFKMDEEFRAKAINTVRLEEFNIYLVENAMLYLEMPNAYNRWTKIDHDHFCVDVYNNRFSHKKLAFWVEQKQNDDDEPGNDDFLTGAMLVSCCFLLVVLIVYAVLPELRNLCGLILMAYVASLFSALLCLAVIRMKVHSDDICYGLTLVIYYFFLASFCWMNVMSYDIWWTFRGYAKARPIHRRGEPFKYMMYSLYAWGVPLALTIMLAWINASDLRHKPWFIKPNLPSVGCFIEGGEKLLYLYMPMLILICANWLFFLMTAFNIWRLSRGTSVLDTAAAGTPAAHRNHRQRFLVYLKLTVVMGLNWILEVISFLVPGFRFWYLTDIYNILIGVSIFLIFVCKRKILRKLTKLYVYRTRNRSQSYPSTSTRSNTTASESSQETQTLQVCANPKGPGYVVNNF